MSTSIWWSYTKGMIRQYPMLREERAALKEPSMIADYSGRPHGSTPGDQTAAAAGRTLPGEKEREYWAVENAVRSTRKRNDGKERIRLIDLIFWRRTHTLQGAADALHISYRTARRWHTDFIHETWCNYR